MLYNQPHPRSGNRRHGSLFFQRIRGKPPRDVTGSAMPHLPKGLVFVLGVWLGGGCSHGSAAAEDHVYHHENVMGTSLELRVTADDPQAARWAEGCVLDEIDRLSGIFSGYDKTSEFSRWQAKANRAVRVSPELFEVLEACDLWMARSGGAFE